MIDHSKCNHPRTRAGRAACRRGKAAPWPAPPLYSLGPPPFLATPKEATSRGARAGTPGFKSDECHICGVERIEFRGTDAWTGFLVYVGEKCAWRVKRSPDFEALRP